VQCDDSIKDCGTGRDAGGGDVEGDEGTAGGGQPGGATNDQKLATAIGQIPRGDVVDGGVLAGAESGCESAEQITAFEGFRAESSVRASGATSEARLEQLGQEHGRRF
jgi:hypothetical protein